jgi:hypothetical protein
MFAMIQPVPPRGMILFRPEKNGAILGIKGSTSLALKARDSISGHHQNASDLTICLKQKTMKSGEYAGLAVLCADAKSLPSQNFVELNGFPYENPLSLLDLGWADVPV